MTQGRKGIIVIAGVAVLVLIGSLYNRHIDRKIKENLKLVVATIYSVDNEVKYRHYRIKFYYYVNPRRRDSSQTFRDDLNSNCFWNLKGKDIGLALDSLNALHNGHLLITKDDFEMFGITIENGSRLKIYPQCD